MSESQAFFLLSVLCDRLLPGYYSTTMYGTLLDQRVFESLVEKTMPILWEHLVRSDVQLSVVSLPWFLSLYINSMPLVFAFRVLDVFFLEGPKVLFQVGLAILRINGEELLDVSDDGTFISILKNYFSRLDESAHPKSENEKLRAVTKFQELMVVAFKEFSGITQSTISEQRSKFKNEVLDNIENFAKRTSIRNLGPESKRLSADDLSLIYDRFYEVLYEQERDSQIRRQESQKLQKPGSRPTEILTGANNNIEMGRVGLGPSPELMNYDGFRTLLAGMSKWAIADAPRTPYGDLHYEKDGRLAPTPTPRHSEFPSSPLRGRRQEPADHDFMQRLFGAWNKDDKDGLSLQNVVSGLAYIKGSRDLMETIAYFFNLYDDNKDGKVDREGILRMSEALLFLTRRGLEGNFTLIGSAPNGLDESLKDGDQLTISGATLNEKFLSSVSAFIRRCFEYADPDHPQNQVNNETADSQTQPSPTIEKFSIGDDEDDLLDISEEKQPNSPEVTSPQPLQSPRVPQTPQTPSKQSANLALDPANPLHITLPTFRMVVLADELLQQFFEFSFAESFHITPQVAGRVSSFSLQTPTLTTFSSLNTRQIFAPTAASGGADAPSRGLRGLLDNIVTDGMRVAAEVRKRMDEAQKELERNATARGDDDYDEEEDDSKMPGLLSGDSEKRSVREKDRDLLEGAEVGSIKENEGIISREQPPDLLTGDNTQGEKMFES
jgi:TBC1 domain family member 8/9